MLFFWVDRCPRALCLRALPMFAVLVYLLAGAGGSALGAEVAKDKGDLLLPEAPGLGVGVLPEAGAGVQAVSSTSSSQGATPGSQTAGQAPSSAGPGDGTAAQPQTDRERSEAALKKEEKQRIMGVLPNFNITYDQNVPPLSPRQKFQLAFRSAVDPMQFVVAAVLAGVGQADDSFEGYGQGAQGYAKRFGAQYADNFDGTMIGNAVLPVILKEDPRYFRRGTGTIQKRMLYSISTAVWCKRDNGTWGPNYANVLGNLAAGGISNLYYPATDRGAGLVFSNALTVTWEGMVGGLANEFLPDLTRHFLHRDISGRKTSDVSTVPMAPQK